VRLVVTVKPQVDNRVLWIADDIVLLTRFDDQDLSCMYGLGPAVDLDRALALHNAKDLDVVVDVFPLWVRAPANRVKAEPAVGNESAGDELRGDVFGSLGPQVRKLVAFHCLFLRL
jgi:hypothetical protein